MKNNNLTILSGTSNELLSEDIINLLKYNYNYDNDIICKVNIIGHRIGKTFNIEVKSDIKDKNLVIIQSLNTEENYIQMIDIIKESKKYNPKNIILVIPMIDLNLSFTLNDFFKNNDIDKFIYLTIQDMIELNKRKFNNKIHIPDSFNLSWKIMTNSDYEILLTDEFFSKRIHNMVLNIEGE